MNGKHFNNLVKTMKIVKDVVPMTHEVKLVDAAHVMMMQVKSLDGSPVFGVESGGVLDIKHMITMPDEDFEAGTIGNHYILRNEESIYEFGICDEDYRDPKIPKLELCASVEVPAKTVQNAIKSLKDISDHATIQCDGQRLTMSAVGESVKVSKILRDCDIEFKTMMPMDYLERIAKVTTGMIVMEWDTDYPTRWTWNDGCHEYITLLAPRIENKE